jgi:hypothetical protein
MREPAVFSLEGSGGFAGIGWAGVERWADPDYLAGPYPTAIYLVRPYSLWGF